jgi:hypothetical protein
VFVDKLQNRYTGAQLLLKTVAWGGRTSDSFLNEPKGSQHNFDHSVIEQKPDLVIMEFVSL